MLSVIAVLFAALLLGGCGGMGRPGSIAGQAAEGFNETLIARDIGDGTEVSAVRWCGNDAVVYSGKAIGVVLLELSTGKRVTISRNYEDVPRNCTPDGKWILYTDSSGRRDDSSYEEYGAEGPLFGWMGDVVDLYAYEAATGRREKVAAVRTDVGYEVFSPDGKKVLLGARHSYSSEEGSGGWEKVWLTDDWGEWTMWYVGPVFRWFPDSAAVLTLRYEPKGLCAQRFGAEGWDVCFDLGKEHEKIIASSVAIDGAGRIYFSVSAAPSVAGMDTFTLFRCEIAAVELRCAKMMERNYYMAPRFLRNGDMILQDAYRQCIRLIPSGRADGGCFLRRRHGEKLYDDLSMEGVSPDRGRIAVVRETKSAKDEGRSRVEIDLFVVDFYEK